MINGFPTLFVAQGEAAKEEWRGWGRRAGVFCEQGGGGSRGKQKHPPVAEKVKFLGESSYWQGYLRAKKTKETAIPNFPFLTPERGSTGSAPSISKCRRTQVGDQAADSMVLGFRV